MHTIRPWLRVGGLVDILSLKRLEKEGVTALLTLHQAANHPEIPELYLHLEEGEPISNETLAQAIGFAHAQIDAGQVLCIACGAGISRSVMVTMAVLRERENLSLIQAYHEIRRLHPDAMPDQTHWKALCDYYGESNDFWKVWRQVNGLL
jgi:protein-tyrosine phosphatase